MEINTFDVVAGVSGLKSEEYETQIDIVGNYVLERPTPVHDEHLGLIEEIRETEDGCVIIVKGKYYNLHGYSPKWILSACMYPERFAV